MKFWPKLVLGPAGTGKTHLIFAVLDAARSKGKEFICASFNAITAMAIGGDTFTAAFFGVLKRTNTIHVLSALNN
jgi:sigma54-dependent transcription regulator